ncbi:MAG: haloacid dehalogenase type II [Amylibacter sp.]|nr:haloacid dehalogenase type II [Amylibacter sp.]
MTITTCVFDAYGTLFDVAAAARRAASEPGRETFAKVWVKVATDWRLKQLQYTWLRAIMDAHTDFWEVTQNGLDYALEASDLSDDTDLRERLLALYWELEAYEEVPQMLKDLKTARLQTAILSNGSPDMLSGAVKSAGLKAHFDAVLSVENVGIFKPDPRIYQMVCDRFNCPPAQVLFVSSNGWDAAGATKFGFQTVWVNRAGEPVDRLPWVPENILKTLHSIPDLAKAL